MLQIQLNGTVNQKSIDLGFLASLQFSDIRTYVALFFFFLFFSSIFTTTHKVYYSSHPRIQDYYHVNNTEYGSKSALYQIRYQQRTKDDHLPPRNSDRQKCVKILFLKCLKCLNKFKYVAKYSECTYSTTYYSYN